MRRSASHAAAQTTAAPASARPWLRSTSHSGRTRRSARPTAASTNELASGSRSVFVETSWSQMPAASTTSTNEATTAVMPAPAAASASSASHATWPPTTTAIPTSSLCQRRGTASATVAARMITANADRRPRQARVDRLQGGARAAPSSPIAATVSDDHAIAMTTASAARPPASGSASQSGTRS